MLPGGAADLDITGGQYEIGMLREGLQLALQPFRCHGIADTLSQEQRLNPRFRLLLAGQLYRDLRVLSRFDPARCWLTLRCIQDLQPGFQPDPALEPSRWWRHLSGWLGLKRSLRLYRWLLLLPDQLRFRGGDIRYFQS